MGHIILIEIFNLPYLFATLLKYPAKQLFFDAFGNLSFSYLFHSFLTMQLEPPKASGVGGRFHARAMSWGAALVRGPVRRSARGRIPLTRNDNLLQGGVIVLEVCLAWYREGCALRKVASWIQVDVWRRQCRDRVGVTHARLHEGIERVVVAVVSAG